MTLISHVNHARQPEKPRLVGSAYVHPAVGPFSHPLTAHRSIFDDVEVLPGYGNNVTDDIWADESDKPRGRKTDRDSDSTRPCGTIHPDVQVMI